MIDPQDHLFSNKQLESIRTSNSKINVWVGSIRSGKTFAATFRFILECWKGPPGEFIAVSKTIDAFKRNIIPILNKLIPRYYSWSIGKRELRIFNRLIHVVGAADESSESVIRGSTFAGAFMDEITVIPQVFYDMLLTRLSVDNSKFFGTTNPDSPYHWFKESIDQSSDTKVFDFRLDDNPDLSDEVKEFYNNQFTGLWYRRFIEGQWCLAEGTVFDFFEHKYHVVNTYPSSSYTIVGVDYGTVNPCAFVMISVNPNKYPNWVVIKEYYWDSQKKHFQKTDIDYAKDLKAFCEGHPVKAIYVDPSAASFKAECRKQNLSGFVDGDNDIDNGVRFVSKMLMKGRFKIYRECENLIKEFQSYTWDQKAKERGFDRPAKKNDHALDGLRYALYTHFKGEGDPESHQRCVDAWNQASGTSSNLPGIFSDEPMHAGAFVR